jgi:hypothetical protein
MKPLLIMGGQLLDPHTLSQFPKYSTNERTVCSVTREKDGLLAETQVLDV